MRRHVPCRNALAIAVVLVAPLLPAGDAAAAEWARTFGGPTAGEGVHAVREMPSGEIVIAASTDGFGTTTGDAWLIRLDAAGSVLAQSVIGNAAPGGVDGAVVLPDGGAVFASRSVRDIFLIHDATITRVAADGTPMWTTDVKSSPTGRYFVNDVIAASDGTFVGVGQASLSDAGPFVGWLVRLAADGTVLWQQCHGGVVGSDLSFDAGVQTADGGFAMTGWIVTAGGEDVFVAKATSGGALSWSKSMGGPSADRGNAIVELPGGGLAVAGSTDSFTASGHAGWVIALDAAGALVWHDVLGDAEWSDLQAAAIDSTGALVVLGRIGEPGFATNDLWALQLDAAAGSIGWQRAYEGASGDYAAEAALMSDTSLLLSGTWGWGFPEEDLWLLRTDAAGRIPGCGLIRDTTVVAQSPRVMPAAGFLPPYPPIGSASAGSVVTGPSSLSTATQCVTSACPALLCDAIIVDPLAPCEGTQQQLRLSCPCRGSLRRPTKA